MSKKRGLGRGLDALIPTRAEGHGTTDTVQQVPLESIRPNPQQPRSNLDEGKLRELASSIEIHGLIQPLIVTQDGNQFTLIAGERRWRASQLAGLEIVPVVVKEVTPQEQLELALIENIQRDDLNALEEAYAYQHLIEDFGLTQAEVAERVGKGRSTVANSVRLTGLPENIQAAVADGRISGAHARALLGLPTAEMQTAAMSQVIKLNLSVRQTEALVQNLSAAEKPASRQRPGLSAELVALQSDFEQSLGTKVSIENKANGGRVVIHYYNDDDLQAIYESIVGR